MNKTNLKDYTKFMIISFIIMAIYELISYAIFPHLHMRITPSVLLIEVPFGLIFMNIFYFPRYQNRAIKYLFPIVPLLTLYIGFDIFYSYLSRSPRISDFENLITIYYFFPKMLFVIVLSILLILSLIYMVFFYAKNLYSDREYKYTILARLLTLIVLVSFLQTNLFISYQNKIFKFARWAEKRTIKDNGKISSFIYYSNVEIKNRKLLEKQSKNNIKISKILYPNRVINRQNIYYVVLESFINPNYLVDMQYSKNPLSDELKKYLYNGDFSKIKSPVYGGRTAQAEFELLTGIKAFAKVNSIEFNVMKGEQIDSFLYQFKKNGYKTLATVATESGYFNSTVAYKSIGFDKVLFLEEEKSFKKDKSDKMIFDGDLFAYNIKQIKRDLNSSNRPIFNYILGVYGHMPFERNRAKRADTIKLLNSDNDFVEKIANQFYYRTEALAKYIKNIIAIDPNGIIMVSSDHIPPSLLDDKTDYKYDKYTNIALLINRGKAIDISGMSQYEVPWYIWDIVSNNKDKRRIDNSILEKLYFKALYESLFKS